MTAVPRAPTRRLFLALWPTAEERRALEASCARAVTASGGRAVPSANFHVTLAFLGNVAPERTAELVASTRGIGAACDASALVLHFATLAYWRQPKILCALAGAPCAAADALAAALKRATRAAGFFPDLKPFRAHVTVARKVARAPEDSPLASVRWHGTTLALVESRSHAGGALYSVLDSQLLGKSEKVRGVC